MIEHLYHTQGCTHSYQIKLSAFAGLLLWGVTGMRDGNQLLKLVRELRSDIESLCQSGNTWKITLHGGRDGRVKVERTTYDEVAPLGAHPPPKQGSSAHG